MRWLLVGRVSLCKSRQGFGFDQKCGLVNVKLKWVKDKELDAVVVGEKHVKAVSNLVSLISSSPDYTLPISPHRGQLGLPPDLKLSSFLRRFPNIFVERDTRFGLTSEAIDLHREEAHLLELNKGDLLARLCKLLMLTRERSLPLHSIDHLRWDMGLPYDYRHSLLPSHPDLFSLVKLSSDLVGLKLMHWDERLAVSHLQGLRNDNPMAFPVKFTRGFGLKRKSMEWLHEWQRLPYTSPYLDASHLDPRTDLSEKRNVGVFHELLHLTIGKKMERKNVSNLRKPFALPYKFTKVFERHPGIFYISLKCDTQTVILREAYDRRHLLEKHPLVEIRAALANMVTSRGLYQKSLADYFGTKIIYPEEEESDSGSDYPLVEQLKHVRVFPNPSCLFITVNSPYCIPTDTQATLECFVQFHSMSPRWKWKGAEAEPVSKINQFSLAKTEPSRVVLIAVELEQAELLNRCCFGRHEEFIKSSVY